MEKPWEGDENIEEREITLTVGMTPLHWQCAEAASEGDLRTFLASMIYMVLVSNRDDVALGLALMTKIRERAEEQGELIAGILSPGGSA